MTRGQVNTAGAIIIASITLIGGFFTARTTANQQVTDQMGNIKTDVAVLQVSHHEQEKTIEDMKSNIEYIRRSVEEINKKLGVIVK